jgi:hypothetical protein
MTITAPESLAQTLRPIAPPRVVEGLYSDDQYERLLGVVKRHGPWPTVAAHHFRSVDELIATSSGVVPKDHGLTLDSIASANFRGFLAENSCCYYPELHDVFYNSRFLELVKDYWGAQYAKPTLMLFNLCGPHQSGLSAHLDAVTFRGVRIENTPVWMQNVMAKSGLFRDYLVKMAQIVTWFWLGEEGTFTYWPDGPLAPPQRIEHPMWNKGVVVQNEMMFHRGDPVGRPDERAIAGLAHRSLMGYRPERDDWAITTDGEVVRSYEPGNVRLLIHWNAELYMDRHEAKLVMDHTDDLTHDRVVDTLLRDMRSKGVQVSAPSDPFHDDDFIHALMSTYTIAPTTDWIEGSPWARHSAGR